MPDYTDTQDWPIISEALMEKLQQYRPEKSYDIKKSHNENVQYSGEVKLVRRIQLEFNKQQRSSSVPPPS